MRIVEQNHRSRKKKEGLITKNISLGHSEEWSRQDQIIRGRVLFAISIYFVYFSCFSFFSTLLLYHFVVVDWSISFLKETEKKREREREKGLVVGWIRCSGV